MEKVLIKDLPEPYKSKAIEYTEINYIGLRKQHIDELIENESFYGLFAFNETLEGFDYWWNIYEKITNKNKINI